MGGVLSFVEDVFEAVGDVVESVGEAVVDVVDFVVDKIVEPVVETVGNVIQAAIDDPIKTIAQVAAVVTQQYWMLPLIEGADVAIAGGDIGDVLEATAKAYVTQAVGSYVGNAAGSFAGDAIGSAASEGTKQIITDAVSSGVRNATVAIVQGRDPMDALITGGVTAGVAAGLGQIDGFKEFAKTSPAAARAISNGLGAALTGGNVGAATVMGAIEGARIVQDIIKEFDPQNGTPQAKLTPQQTAIVTDVLMNTTSAALTGGSPSAAVRGALLKAGSKALGDMVASGFKDTTTKASTAYDLVTKNAEALEKNQAAQKDVVDEYNNVKWQLETRMEKQQELADKANAAIATYNANRTTENYNAAMAAKKEADDYTTQFNKDYREFFKPTLDQQSTTLKTLQSEQTQLSTGYTESMDGFKNAIDNLTAALDPVYLTSNRAVVEAMNPEFKADEYRKLNGLAADVDPYAHFLEKGQFEGLPTNNAAVKDLVQKNAAGTAVDKVPSSALPKPEEVFDGTEYKTVAAAQKNAAALGRTYFMGPDGNTYKIMSDTETKDKIKGAATFGEAFTMARKTLGSGATFEWTNPETGKTSSFTTQTKEEAAASANAGSLVKVNDEVKNYVTDKIVGNITDYKNFNPADLTKAEYQGFINSYLNATDAQRQRMLNGADKMTYSVIANVLKDAPEAIKTKGTAFSVVPTGEIKASDYTNVFGTVKTGLNMVAADLAGVGVRAAQWAGDALGADTSTLTKMQDILANGKDREMSKLVGMERPVAAGIASFIESFGSFYVGGPVAAVLSTGAITANNAWVEGSSAVIDERGNAYSSADEAKKAGVFTFRPLTSQENAIRTAAMTSIEMAFEKLGVPGMSKLMQGVPLTGGADAFVEGIRRNAAGMASEQGTEIATTIAQLTFDKMSSFGLAQNASVADYMKAIGDTVVATAVAVGGSTSTATMLNNVRNASTALRDESAVGVTPMTYNTVVAKDAAGKDVTLAELLTATNIVDLSDPTANNAALANLTPVVDLRSAINMGDMTVTLGDVLSGATTVAQTTNNLTESAVAEIFRASNFVPSDNTVKEFVGKPASAATFTSMNTFVEQNKLDVEEVILTAREEGVVLTEAQAQQYVQQGNESELRAQLRAQLDPKATTADEVREMFKELGYDVPAKAFGRPSPEIIRQFMGEKSEAEQREAIRAYVDPRQITFDEAKAIFTSRGYNPTDEEVRMLVAQSPDADLAERQGKFATEYVDPRLVDEQEVRDAWAALGLKKPTKEDVAKLVGQYSESELAGKATAGLDAARYNSIMEQINTLAVGAGVDPAVLDTIKADLNKQITELGGDITKLSGDVAAAKTDLTKAIADAQKGNASAFADVNKAIADLKSAGLTTEQVQGIVAEAGTGLSTEFKTALAEAAKGNAAALETVQTNLTAKIEGVQTALETALGDQAEVFNTKVQDLMDQGKTYQEATAQTLADMGIKIDDLGADFATKLGELDTALTTKISDVEATLSAAIADAKAAGLKGDEALQAALDTVAADLGTTKNELLTQLGTTEAALKTEFATQLGTLSADVQAKYDALTTEQKALANQLTQQGTDLNTAIDTAKTELSGAITGLSADVQAKYDALTTEQKALANQLTQQGTDLNTAIDTAKTELSGAITGLSADVQAKYDALTTEQKALATQLTQQGIDLNTAIDTAKTELQTQIGDVQTNLQTQIGDVQTNLQTQLATQYAGLTQGQKDLTDALTKQGIDLNTAIQAVQAESVAGMGRLSTQIADEAEATRQANAREAERVRQANARNAVNLARAGNLNTMLGMLGQAQDLGGQQVTVKQADPAKIGYIYDWSSIFANPQQEKMFASPYGAYAKGGTVRSEVDEVNDELLKLLRG